MGSRQWAVGSGQWAVGSRQWAVGSRQRCLLPTAHRLPNPLLRVFPRDIFEIIPDELHVFFLITGGVEHLRVEKDFLFSPIEGTQSNGHAGHPGDMVKPGFKFGHFFARAFRRDDQMHPFVARKSLYDRGHEIAAFFGAIDRDATQPAKKYAEGTLLEFTEEELTPALLAELLRVKAGSMKRQPGAKPRKPVPPEHPHR